MHANDIVKFSDAALIAVHALAALPPPAAGTLVSGRELAELIASSENHLAKVMQRLVRAGLAASSKGPAGGFRLAREARTITLREIVETIDGPLGETFCPFRRETCERTACVFGKELQRHAHELVAYLGKRTLADAIEK